LGKFSKITFTFQKLKITTITRKTTGTREDIVVVIPTPQH